MSSNYSSSTSTGSKPTIAPSSSRKRSAAEYDSDVEASDHKAKPKAKKVKISVAPSDEIALFAVGDATGGCFGDSSLTGMQSDATMISTFDPSVASKPHLVDVATGLKHSVAISADNKIFTWGIDLNSCLGRPASGAKGQAPAVVSGFAANDVFVQVAAADSASFVLTASGYVYGWGSFTIERPDAAMGVDAGAPHFHKIIRTRLARAKLEGPKTKKYDSKFGYDVKGKLISIQSTPVLIPGLSNVVQLVAGSNHVLALDNNGNVWSWGSNDRGQLGRQCYGRRPQDPLVPYMMHACRGTAKTIGTGMNHSFIIDKRDNVWAWGENSNCETGHSKNFLTGEEFIEAPVKVPSLSKRKINMVTGGLNHSMAVNEIGGIVAWGNIKEGQCGVKPSERVMKDRKQFHFHDQRGAILLKPQSVNTVGKGPIQGVYCGINTTFVINKAGKIFATGQNTCGQLGLGHMYVVQDLEAVKSSKLGDKGALFVAAGEDFTMFGVKN